MKPLFALLLALAVSVGAGLGAKNITVTADYRVFFSADNPQLQAFEQQETAFLKSDTVAFVVGCKQSVFSANCMAAIRDLSNDAWNMPYVLRVESPSNFKHSYADEEGLVVDDMLPEDAELNVATLADVRRNAMAEPLLAGRFVSQNEKVALIVATVQLPGVNRRAEIPAVTNAARLLKAQYQAQHPNTEFHLIGMVPFNQTLSEATLHDLGLLFPVSFAFMLLVLGLQLRGLRPVLMTVVVILASVVIAMGSAGWAGLVLNTATAAAPVIVMTLAIAHSVHIIVNYRQAQADGADAAEALRQTIAVNWKPISLTSITTVIGFLTMNFSDVPPFRELGNIVAVGVVAAWVLSLTVLPAMLQLWPLLAKASQSDMAGRFAAFAEFLVSKRLLVLIVSFLLMVPVLVQLPKNELNDVFREWFGNDQPVRVGMEYANDHLGGMSALHYTVDSGEKGGVVQPNYLQALDEYASWYRQQPEAAHVSDFSQLIKRVNRNMHYDAPEHYRLPENADLGSQYLTIYELSLPYGHSLKNIVDIEKRRTRMTVILKRLNSSQTKALDARAMAWLESQNSPLLTPGGSGTPMMFAMLGERNVRSLLGGTLLALVLISLLLCVALKSVKIGLISLIPNLLPAALGFGVWAMLSAQVNMALSVVAGMTLGIVVDDTIHLLSKYLHGRCEGRSAREAVVYAMKMVGQALTVTTVVLVVGFAILAMSSFKPTADMGLLTAITIALALLADFFVLPPLLTYLDRDNKK